MNIFKKFRLTGIAVVLMLSMVLAACGNSDSNNSGTNTNSGDTGNKTSSGDLGKKDLTIPYVAWAGAVASTNTVAAVLENVGYNVTLKQVAAGIMFSSVADGSADAFTAAWLPVTHKSYWDKYGDKLVKLNETIDKAPLGLTVPKYMDINSIADLKGNTKLGKELNWTITGIDPGAGEMEATTKALKTYGLDKWHLQASSGPAMTGALKKAEDAKKPIIVTLWKPHWAFAQWDLKILKDPKKVYGDADGIYTIARKGLKDDSPAAYKILSQFDWNYDDMHKVMSAIHGGTKADKAGKNFVKNNPDLVKKWTKGVTAAK